MVKVCLCLLLVDFSSASGSRTSSNDALRHSSTQQTEVDILAKTLKTMEDRGSRYRNLELALGFSAAMFIGTSISESR